MYHRVVLKFYKPSQPARYLCISTFKPSAFVADVKDGQTAATNNIVLIVIDALRSDMISSPKYSDNWPMLKRIMQQGIVECSTATLSSPTVTGPRIKAISTGRLSEFLDAIYNTESLAVTQDSWVRRLADRRKHLEIYGDDTWLKLFPKTFTRADGTSSFFVNDFYEVDSNVTRHLDARIPAVTEWDAMVLHFLGLDHIGHVEGPMGASTAPKLREMDEVVWKVYQHLVSCIFGYMHKHDGDPWSNGTRNASGRQDWLLAITGDHGMSDQGSHGGASFFETSTTLLLISPKFADVPTESACELNGNVYSQHTDQTDLATLIGLLTGVGIPSGSIGVPSARTLLAFWPQALERLRVLLQLQQHLNHLVTFVLIKSGRSHLFVPNEVADLQQVKNEIMGLLEVCSGPVSKSSNECGRLDSRTDQITRRLLSLMHRFQKRVLLSAVESNLQVVGISIIFMWVIALSFCLPAMCELLCTQDIVHLETTRDQIYTLMVKLLAAFTLSILGLHLSSLFSSSLVEEEHQTWYFFSTSVLSFVIIVMAVADHASDRLRVRGTRILSITLILIVDRFLLRHLNKTGDKWIHLPDLTDWLNENETILWSSEVFAWLLLVFCVRLVLCHPAPRFRSYHMRSVGSLLLVAVSQLVYRYASSVPSGGRSHAFSWTSAVWPARIAYVCILLDLFTSLQMTAALVRWSNALSADADHSHESPVITSGGNPSVSPLHAFGLLAMLLGRPSGTLLWAGVLLKETLLTHAFHSELVASSRCSAHAQTKMKYFLVMLYWIQGWTTFFQAGNSNKFNTIDLAAGYVGLSSHTNALFLLLTVSYTFAGPIFWQLSLFYRFFASQYHRTRWSERNSSNHLKGRFGSLSLGLLTATTTVSATACFILHNHLFIWSVFAPKLFYMAVLNIVFIPLLVLIDVF
ncbi:unnamed protein product [Schistocephalus solidus]|uniref:GPI ethanolamine phosphate transferase 2 n=1 Tax=Schistocephalus solidus TaxID=70667 RepID=A0A183SY84_SCHSO|nr:unnamed protein product [Schistocephalus solidus]